MERYWGCQPCGLKHKNQEAVCDLHRYKMFWVKEYLQGKQISSQCWNWKSWNLYKTEKKPALALKMTSLHWLIQNKGSGNNRPRNQKRWWNLAS